MLVRVVNDNVYPYSEKYRGKMINIPPKGFVEMDFNEASHFLGTNPGTAEVDAGGSPKPESYKMLRIERPDQTKAAVPESKKWVCMADGREFPTQSALEAHVAENYMDDMVDEKAKEKLKAKRKSKKGVTDDTSTDRDGGPA
jgi:hypothetical protein